MVEVIDLTYDIEEKMTTYDVPWHSRVSITQLGRINVEGRETRKICLGTHTGTHIDAPLHFIEKGRGIEQLPLENMIGPVTIVDFSHLKNNTEITKEMIEKIKITERMLFKFGWGKHWGTDRFYKGFPYFSSEAAEYMISKKIRLLAMDTPAPDNLNSETDSPIHKILLANGVILVEYVANLDKVMDYSNWNIAAIPLRLKGVDGSPARVFIYR